MDEWKNLDFYKLDELQHTSSRISERYATCTLAFASPNADQPSHKRPRIAATLSHHEVNQSEKSCAAPAGNLVPLTAFHKNATSEAVRGATSSIISILITFPLNKLMSRQVYEGLTISEAFHTMKVEGSAYLYRGVGPVLMQKATSMALMYGSFDFFHHLLSYAFTGRIESRAATDVPASEVNYALTAAAAWMSGSFEGILAPFERIQTILQHRHYTDQFTNSLDVARKLRPYGIREYYRGVTAVLSRNGPANAIFFTLRNPVKEMLPAWPDEERETDRGRSGGANGATAAVRSDTEKGTTAANTHKMAVAGAMFSSGFFWNRFRDFFSGAVLGACISTVMYPLNMAKGVMQLQIGGRFRGITETIRQVYHERNGLRGMYRGVGVNATRSLLSWGVVNMSYEALKKVFHPEQPRQQQLA